MELNVTMFWRSIHTPDKSRGEEVASGFDTLREETFWVDAAAARLPAVTSVKIARSQCPRSLITEWAFKFPITSQPRNTRIWRLS